MSGHHSRLNCTQKQTKFRFEALVICTTPWTQWDKPMTLAGLFWDLLLANWATSQVCGCSKVPRGTTYQSQQRSGFFCRFSFCSIFLLLLLLCNQHLGEEKVKQDVFSSFFGWPCSSLNVADSRHGTSPSMQVSYERSCSARLVARAVKERAEHLISSRWQRWPERTTGTSELGPGFTHARVAALISDARRTSKRIATQTLLHLGTCGI